MRSPSKPSFLGTVVALLLVFLLCTGSISSVFARVPLVRRQSNNGVETQWAAHTLPGVVDGPGPGPGPEMGNDNNNILNNNEQVLADTIPVCCTLKEPLIEKTSTICEQVTPEAICDGNLYDCPMPASELETSDILTKCTISTSQAPARITDGVIKALPYPLILCALFGAFLSEGPGYHCLEGF